MMNLFEFLTNIKKYNDLDACYVTECVRFIPEYPQYLTASENLDVKEFASLLDNSNT